MAEFKKDCFAYTENDGKFECEALDVKSCDWKCEKECPFYKVKVTFLEIMATYPVGTVLMLKDDVKPERVEIIGYKEVNGTVYLLTDLGTSIAVDRVEDLIWRENK